MSYSPYAAWQPPQPQPAPTPPADPLAVAVGNGSLLGIGYLMLRRWRMATVNLIVVGALVVLLLVLKKPWCESALAGWWVLAIAHGWFLAHTQPRKATDVTKRVLALGITVPLLLAVGLIRYDAGRVEDRVSAARKAGDCAELTEAQRELWFGHRIVDAPGTAQGAEEVRLCKRLEDAKAKLETGLLGDQTALRQGFDVLGSVLAAPGHDRTVEVTLRGWLGDLPVKDPCRTVRITDWLRQRKATNDVLDQSRAVVPQLAPAAIAGCAGRLMTQKKWADARTAYQQLVGQYPKDGRVAKAKAGIRQATLALELLKVRDLLARDDYCSAPARYSGAAPYQRGLNRAVFEGSDEYTARLPASWRAGDVSTAVLVVCTEQSTQGAPVRTCPYHSVTSPMNTSDVTFYKIAAPVKAYELRTGRLVSNTRVQINGAACPSRFSYTTYLPGWDYPPSSQPVKPSNANVQAAFRYLFVR
ncbi:hypothetical protein Kfla_6209 [Kribbella flavida DSM 17836]|uniref:Uncharacterized protein n=1 Tax=Kribbella flavida (strain DSM 17836 / JCM 10339 / NBRC 14399) TaxID=479435 RepID=D2PVH2_KRIFD|nr:hypothetical protein [Kribbella flavida]ADB35212.1 hypothetical protein Kfla_6209 [Kribbella flavida DSM 17836]